ncbi:hypothetical protein D3C76_1592720 [compost metagenome]
MNEAIARIEAAKWNYGGACLFIAERCVGYRGVTCVLLQNEIQAHYIANASLAAGLAG